MKDTNLEAIYQQQFRIRAYEVGPGGKLKLSALLDYMQESAAEHANRLGVSVRDLMTRNLTWVLSRYHIRIFRYSTWGETIYINTWPAAKINLFALREFEIVNSQHEKIGLATSSWLLLDLNTKQPVRPEDHLPPYPHHSERALADAFEPLPKITHPDLELPFRVRLADLDVNRHVNHVRFIEWALETVPSDVWSGYEPAELEIAFRGEAVYGDTVIVRTQRFAQGDSPTFLHQIVRELDETELTRLTSRWMKRSQR